MKNQHFPALLQYSYKEFRVFSVHREYVKSWRPQHLELRGSPDSDDVQKPSVSQQSLFSRHCGDAPDNDWLIWWNMEGGNITPEFGWIFPLGLLPEELLYRPLDSGFCIAQHCLLARVWKCTLVNQWNDWNSTASKLHAHTCIRALLMHRTACMVIHQNCSLCYMLCFWSKSSLLVPSNIHRLSLKLSVGGSCLSCGYAFI